MISAGEADAGRTYDAFAPSYDDFNHGYMYERWTGRLMAKAEDAGLQGNRLLDVACGTGLSFLAQLEQGWQVTGCDISPEMVELARAKVGERASLHVADMRELPVFGEFDLVWSVNDALNYLLSPEEFEAAMTGIRRNLAPVGVLVFDVNTLATYRTFFGGEHVVERGGRRFVWRGSIAAEEVGPGMLYEARFEGEGEDVQPHMHYQRHFTESEVLAAIESAGLRCVEVAGELDGNLSRGVDQDRHTKSVYVCRRADRDQTT